MSSSGISKGAYDTAYSVASGIGKGASDMAYSAASRIGKGASEISKATYHKLNDTAFQQNAKDVASGLSKKAYGIGSELSKKAYGIGSELNKSSVKQGGDPIPLSKSAIIGIIVASVFATIIVIIALYYGLKSKNKTSGGTTTSGTTTSGKTSGGTTPSGTTPSGATKPTGGYNTTGKTKPTGSSYKVAVSGVGSGANVATIQAGASSAGIGSGANIATIQTSANAAGVGTGQNKGTGVNAAASKGYGNDGANSSGYKSGANSKCSGGQCGGYGSGQIKSSVKASKGQGPAGLLNNMIAEGIDLPFVILEDIVQDGTGAVTAMCGDVWSMFSSIF